MRHVAVGEYDLPDLEFPDEKFEFSFFQDRNALGIQRACQRSGITASGNAGNLRRGEGDHLGRPVVAEGEVEIVEVAPGGAEYDRPRAG